MNNESLFENSQLAVSYELLQFLRWVIMTKPETLNALMYQAYESGCMDQESSIAHSLRLAIPSNEELQRNVLDFFDILETKLQETAIALEHEMPSLEKAFRPAVNHIDSSLCDNNTVALSIKQASSQVRFHNPQTTPEKIYQETLYKELLKNWRPRNKQCLH